MSEYEQFRDWARAKARELEATPEAERRFLRDLHGLTEAYLEVSEALREIGRGSLFSLWTRLRRHARLASDPLAGVRDAMRRIRARHDAPGASDFREP